MIEDIGRLVKFAQLAKAGGLQQNELDAFVSEADIVCSDWDRASLLRFALRLSRYSKLDPQRAREELRVLYVAEANKHSVPEKQLRMLLWANAYGAAADLRDCEDAAITTIYNASEPQQRLQTVCSSGLCFRLDGQTGQLFLHTTGGWRALESGLPGGNIAIPVLLGGDIEGDVAQTVEGWTVSGRTRVGKLGSVQNDDGLLISRREGVGLIAIADGTGDSKLGFRASFIALRYLGEAFAAGASAYLSAECAAAAVQADNLSYGLDGLTTLAASMMHDQGVNLLTFGDPVAAIGMGESVVHMSSWTGEQRCALGGEPLGDTITSSGRLVTNLKRVSREDVHRFHGASAVILGSDGLLLGSREWGEADVAPLIGGQVAAVDAVADLVGRSERAIERGAKADNITSLVAFRTDSGI